MPEVCVASQDLVVHLADGALAAHLMSLLCLQADVNFLEEPDQQARGQMTWLLTIPSTCVCQQYKLPPFNTSNEWHPPCREPDTKQRQSTCYSNIYLPLRHKRYVLSLSDHFRLNLLHHRHQEQKCIQKHLHLQSYQRTTASPPDQAFSKKYARKTPAKPAVHPGHTLGAAS